MYSSSDISLPNVKGDARREETPVQQGSHSPSHPPACSALPVSSLGPDLCIRYQPIGNVCGNRCPAHSAQQAGLFASGNLLLRSLFLEWQESPRLLAHQAGICHHKPDRLEIEQLVCRWREAGKPDPTEWLYNVRREVSPSVMYFLGLPFVEGTEFLQYAGWCFSLDSVSSSLPNVKGDAAARWTLL